MSYLPKSLKEASGRYGASLVFVAILFALYTFLVYQYVDTYYVLGIIILGVIMVLIGGAPEEED